MKPMKNVRWIVLATIALLAAALLLAGCSSGTSTANVKYQCPMHPTVIQDHPGDCPICGMRLVPMKTEEQKPGSGSGSAAPGSGSHGNAEPGKVLYACPMHPEVTSDKPGQKCPKCGMALEPVKPQPVVHPGSRKVLFYRNPMNPKVTSPVPAKDDMGMDYVPVYEDEAATATGAGAGAGTAVPEHASVQLTEEGLRLAGVQTVAAERESLGSSIRAVGQVVPDEKLVRHVHTKISGWIERLYVNATGDEVRRGQPILSIYSQELLATQEEYLRARAAAARFRDATLPEVRDGADDLVRAARQRLELFDVPPAFIDQLDRTGKAQRAVTLVAPVSGYVTSKGTLEGQQVDPSMELYTVTDLSHVWIEADVYESEARKVKVGAPAVLTSPYDPQLQRKGKVAFVYPFLNPETRTLKIRFEFANPKLELKPAMYVNVALDVEPSAGIVVPDSAIIDTGVRQLVFVDKGNGLFEPRDVRVGTRSEGRARVLAGLAEGDRVVIKANFLLDSESRLRAAIAGAAPAAEGGQR